MEFVESLDRLYEGLKFKDAIYKEKANICELNFLYNPELFKPTEENKTAIYNKINVLGDIVNYSVNFIKCPLDKRAIANHTYACVVNYFPSLSKNFSYEDVAVEIYEMNVKINLKLAPSCYDHAIELDRADLVAQKLKESFLADFEVAFVKKSEEHEKDYIKQNMEFMSSIKVAEEKTVYQLTDVTNIIGNNEYSLATDFTKITSPLDNVIICGEVISNQKKTYKRTYTKNGESKEVEKSFYSFAIKNDNKILYCSIFPKQSDEVKGDLIETGMQICCNGSFREYKGKLNYTASSIARCKFSKEEIKSAYKTVNEEYYTVLPQKYIDLEQSGLFDESEKTFDGSFVVFDLETTGLDSNKEEIIEIGACKVVNGRIDEIFSTFVKPSKHIPKEITNITGIDDSMVENAPSINYVMPDFYKFCHGSTLVAHNIAFDISFIYNASKKLSYNFENKLMDTLEMSKKKLPGLKNYKLGTVVEKLNILLENAHRAINDATATAKVFIKLM